MQKNDIIKIKITDVSIDGKGIGRHENIVVFVPCSAVGDYLEVKILKVEKNYSFGKIENIIISSPDRIQIDCKVYPKCGGCAFRHISYEAELKIKENHVKECLGRIAGLDNLNITPIIGAEKILRYRNKMQLPVQKDKFGNIITGFYRLHSHEVIPIGDCILNPEIFSNIAETIKKWMIDYGVEPYNEVNCDGIVRHIYIRQAEKTGEILVCLVVNSINLEHKDALIKLLRKNYDNIIGILININTKKTNVILGDKDKIIYGKDYIMDTVCDTKLNISAKSFCQVNHAQTEILYNEVKKVLDLRGNETVIDLYCGIGSIGLSMVKDVSYVFGVEIVKEAVKNAILNAQINNVKNTKFICMDSSSGFKEIKDKGVLPDIIIIDPPRKGCSEELINNISKINPSKIVYVSCNAATLARDIKEFSKFQFLPNKVIPIDMFPRTAHVECVVLMSRVEK